MPCLTAGSCWNWYLLRGINQFRCAGALKGLASEHRPMHGGAIAMYKAGVETTKKHLLFRNGLDEGIPVLITGCGSHFDSEPFSAEAMQALAEESADQSFKVSLACMPVKICNEVAI